MKNPKEKITHTEREREREERERERIHYSSDDYNEFSWVICDSFRFLDKYL